jgi:hypothetical protein
MAYISTVPLPGQRIRDTQSPINNNFIDIPTLIQINHVGFDSPDAGKHKFITFVDNPAPLAVAGNELGLWNESYVTSSRQELFLKRPIGADVPITGALLQANNGFSWLPSGLLKKWGTATLDGAGAFPINWSFAPAFVGTPFILMLTYATNAIVPTSAVRYNGAFTATGTTVNGTIGMAFDWLVIGKGI